jgi:hypothetical protein
MRTIQLDFVPVRNQNTAILIFKHEDLSQVGNTSLLCEM